MTERGRAGAAEFAARFRAARAYGDLEQEEVAEVLGVNRATVSLWEREKVEVPALKRPGIIELMSEAVGLPVEWWTVEFAQLPEILSERGEAEGARGDLEQAARGAVRRLQNRAQPQADEQTGERRAEGSG